MGGSFSESVPQLDEAEGFICIVFRSPNKIRLLHGTKPVKTAIQNVIRKFGHKPDLRADDKYGTLEFRVSGQPFDCSKPADKYSSVFGMRVACKILESMFLLGYKLAVNTKLTRSQDLSTWFFEKCDPLQDVHVLALAPIGFNRLILLNATEDINESVRAQISDTWTPGILKEKSEDDSFHLKLKGNPWRGFNGEASILSKQLLLNLIGRLSTVKYQFVASSLIFGDCDCLFFVKTGGPSLLARDIAALILANGNKLRLVNFDNERKDLLHKVLISKGMCKVKKHPDWQDFFSAHEMKVRHKPFSCHGTESISTRKWMCDTLECLSSRGRMRCIGSLDLPDISEKSSLLFHRGNENLACKFACVSFTDVNRLRFIHFPKNTVLVLSSVVDKAYLPGLVGTRWRDEACFEMDLNGIPLTHESSYNLHLKSMLVLLLKQLRILGWIFSISCDVSSKISHHEKGPSIPLDVDSWFFYFPFDAQQTENMNMANERISSTSSGVSSAALLPHTVHLSGRELSLGKSDPKQTSISRPNSDYRLKRKASIIITVDDLEDID